MAKKKCPACGSNDIVKVLYGMPTHEASEAAEKGEIYLGGCCIPKNEPKWHCKSCGQKFGGMNIFILLLDMISFEFFIGGYFGTSHFIYIDGERKNKVIRYAQTPGGLFVDLKQPKDDINLYPDSLIKEIPLTSEQWLKFLEELSSLEIDSWKDKYYDNEIRDGTQWDLIITLRDQNGISKSGSNEYPLYWGKFIRILEKYLILKLML